MGNIPQRETLSWSNMVDIFLSGNCWNDDTEFEKEKCPSQCCQEDDLGLNAKTTLFNGLSLERKEHSMPRYGPSVDFSCCCIMYI